MKIEAIKKRVLILKGQIKDVERLYIEELSQEEEYKKLFRHSRITRLRLERMKKELEKYYRILHEASQLNYKLQQSCDLSDLDMQIEVAQGLYQAYRNKLVHLVLDYNFKIGQIEYDSEKRKLFSQALRAEKRIKYLLKKRAELESNVKSLTHA